MAPPCLTTAMSQGESRTTSSIVELKTGGSMPGLVAEGLPPQPKMMRSASISVAASTTPSAARRPILTIGCIDTPSGA